MAKRKQVAKRKPKQEQWALPAVQHEKIDPKDSDTRLMRDGEPSWVQLQRWEGDTTLRAEKWTVCCGCALRHLETYTVFKDGRGNWYLQRRVWADHGTEPKAVEQWDGLKIRRVK